MATIVKGFSTNARIIDNLGDDLLLYTNFKASNYQLIKIHFLHAKAVGQEIVIPEKSIKLENVTIGGDFLFAHYLKNVCSEIILINKAGKRRK